VIEDVDAVLMVYHSKNGLIEIFNGCNTKNIKP
jgi:hypothetical protein